MLSKNAVLVIVPFALAAATVASACKKSSETERREAENAAAEATKEAREAQGHAIDERTDYLAAVRREQLELRGRLQEEIDDVDLKLGDLKLELRPDATVDPKSKDAQKIQLLLERRETLEADANLIERTDERNWDQIRAGIERDLRSTGSAHRRGKI